jgi:hypothetical protein
MINVISPIEPNLEERCRNKFLERMSDAGGDDEVLRLRALQHALHCDVIGSPAPITAD